MRTWISLLPGVFIALTATAGAPQWGGSATLSSNYLLRGVSQSSNDPALSAELHAQFARGLYFSLWSSTSRPREIDSTGAEVGAGMGFVKSLGESWSTRWSFTHYEALWSPFERFYRYDEFTAELRFRDRLLLAVSWLPNLSRYAPTFGPVWNRNAYSFEGTWQRSLPAGVQGYVGAGYYDLSHLFGTGYAYGSVGVKRDWGHWRLDLSYVLTDRSAKRLSYTGAARDRALLTLTAGF
jgi:uncharacterized protein (TIGR02001 family)